jgi:hypothetical protein
VRRHPDRAVTLLRQGGVVDDQDRIRTSDKAIGLAEQRPLQRSLVPDPGRDEVVRPICGIAPFLILLANRMNRFEMVGVSG